MKILKKEIAICLFSGILLFGPLLWYTSRDRATEDMIAVLAPTSIKVEQEQISIGEILYGTKHKATFRMKNTGTTPLLVRDVKTSCGCTKAEWNKKPVSPGQTTEINITFEPNSLGRFIKSIDVHCNTEKPVHTLKLTGQVNEN